MTFFPILFLFSILRLEIYTNNSIFLYLNIIALFVFILKNISFFNFKTQKNTLIIGMFFFMIIIGAFRNNDPDSSFSNNIIKLTNYFLLVFCFYLEFLKKIRDFNDLPIFFFENLYLPLFCLILINIIAYFIGLLPSNYPQINLGKSVLLSLFGKDLDRISFPFTPGFNNYGLIAGTFLIFSVSWLMYFKTHKKVVLLGIIISLFSIFSVDTRSVILFSILTLLISFFNKKKFSNFNWFIPIISILGSFVIIIPVLFLSDIIDLSSIQRTREDFNSFNGRNLIWLNSSIEFLNFKPIHLIGYGEFGHYISGVSKSWSHFFGQWEDEKSLLTTPHSFFYSILFDYGYIGLFLYVFIQYKIIFLIKKLWFSSNLNKLFMNFLLFWNLIGITETSHGFYIPILLYIFSFILIFYIYFLKFTPK